MYLLIYDSNFVLRNLYLKTKTPSVIYSCKLLMYKYYKYKNNDLNIIFLKLY